MATRRIRRTYAPQYDRFNPPEPYYYRPMPQPRNTSILDWLLLLICVVVGAAVLSSWLGIDVRPYVSAPQAQPTVHAIVPPSAPQAQPQAAPQAVEAPAAPIDAAPAQPAAVPPASVPTAAVVQAAPAPVVVVPQAAPRIAPDSIVPTVAPAPTVAVTAPMVAGKDFQAPSKTCVETQRKGETVHFAQLQDLTPAEMSSVADYLRTGMIAGEAGPCAAH